MAYVILNNINNGNITKVAPRGGSPTVGGRRISRLFYQQTMAVNKLKIERKIIY